VLEDDLHFYNKFVLSYDDVNKKMVHVFELEDNGTFEYVLGEGDDLRFFTPEEIRALELDFVAKPVLASYFNLVL
jgi:8-oxo-dGTP pyrophosphatase MutT (NUDIX family)